ncbi:MAG: SDR family oxidoreductase [Burkholderiales bacterium]|nr:SDR family oxidoreductase [Roseateles sp.]MBV8465142.1 SDR family oxidoreductase [Burkholderiales bacterium]
MSVSHQRILIIGGSSGMGFATAKRLVETGAEVFITGRDEAKLETAVAALDRKAVGVAADFTDPSSLQALMGRIGRLDHLVLAAAGPAAWGPFAQLPVDAVRNALNTKLLGYWQSLQAALPILRKDGSVIFMTGAASRVAMVGTAGLAAVNGGITQMAQTLAKELAPLRVNVVSPGLVDTPAYDGLPAEAKSGMFAGAAKGLPVGRTGLPDDIAQAVEMLISNSFATGVLLDIDGGARMPL